MEKFQKLLLANLDKILLAVMGLATVVLIYMVFNETSTVAPEVGQVQKRDPEIQISNQLDNPQHAEQVKPYLDVREIVSPWNQIEDSDYYELLEYNMFDPLEVGQSEEREENARSLVEEAKGLDTEHPVTRVSTGCSLGVTGVFLKCYRRARRA